MRKNELVFKPKEIAPLLSVETLHTVDQKAQQAGLSETALVEIAGKLLASESFKFIQSLKFHQDPCEIAVVAGLGNNGADAMVAARLLHEAGLSVKVFLYERDKRSAENMRTEKLCGLSGVYFEKWQSGCIKSLKPNIIIDGLLGVGLRRPLEDEDYVSIIAEINASKAKVISVDIPSGMHGDFSRTEEPCVTADITVSFSGFKLAFLNAEGVRKTGRVVCVDLGIPKFVIGEENFTVLTHPISAQMDDPLSSFSHKYDRGHTLVFAGSPGKMGAASLACSAASRAGAGWVTLALSERKISQQKLAEKEKLFDHSTVLEPLLDDEGGILLSGLESFLVERKVKTIIFGPGWTKNFLNDAVMRLLQKFSQSGGYVILDAGATHGIISLLRKFPLELSRTILLPHPGEWKKMGDEFADFNVESFANLTSTYTAIKKLNAASFVWKSSVPIFFMTRKIHFFPEKNLARAGTGDLLAGLIAGCAPRFQHIEDAASFCHAGMTRAARSLWLSRDEPATTETILYNSKFFV